MIFLVPPVYVVSALHFFFFVVVKSGEPQGKWKLVYRLIGLRSFEAVLFKLLDHFRKTTKI